MKREDKDTYKSKQLEALAIEPQRGTHTDKDGRG